jgi:hypothetical protein
VKRAAQIVLAACIALALTAATASAFGLNGLDVTFTDPGGSPEMLAGSHPFEWTTKVNADVEGKDPAGGVVKDLVIDQPAGLAIDPTAVPRCSSEAFALEVEGHSACPNSTAIGIAGARGAASQPDPGDFGAVYNLVPPPGMPARFGFHVLGVGVILEGGVRNDGDHHLFAVTPSIPQVSPFFGAVVTLWGVPAAPAHDTLRGSCLKATGQSRGSCPLSVTERPLLTLPTSCSGPLRTVFTATSWLGAQFQGAAETHDASIPPTPLGINGCPELAFNPSISTAPTTKAAGSPTGLDFSLDVHDEGLTSPDGRAQSDIRKAVVTLPEGFSTNPSLAEGLNVCTEADLARETAFSEPGAGCPNESKIGSVEVQTPLLDESLNGAIFIAKPYENEAGSLIALYVVLKNPQLGIIVKQTLKVENDPVTGRITTVADDIPQLPFSHFRLHFREGTRSPLASPPLCGTYSASAVLTPWAGGAPITTTSAFSIISGPNAGACPSGTSQPFHPGLEAGTLNNAAGRYSPFYTHLSRNDGEQEITHFSIKLPPGVIGKLAGIPYCPDAAIAQATARTGPHGGSEELNSPSCPAASEVGRSLAGAGVGPSLAFAPGKIYLAGPYKGSQLSLVSITAAKVGPFDLGTVVVRFALKINPETAEVFVDATGSDPLPHIIKGIPVHLRDIRAYVDRPNFVLNPTNCERTSTASTVLGSGTNFGSEADDQPITVTSPFQAADCASLGFAPKLALSLKGGTKRGATPAFKAVLTYPKGAYANIAKSQVTLPHSEFLEQAHIGTICTRVQFKEGVVPGEKCPPASVYGFAKAITPLLDDPIQGPVYLRSSSHNLPDLVAALHNGQINIALAGRIDSVQNGRIRNTFEAVPDAPVSKFVLEMKGANKGLLVNSTNLCRKTNRAISDFTGQNGKVHDTNPVLVASGCKGNAKKHAAKKHKRSKR